MMFFFFMYYHPTFSDQFFNVKPRHWWWQHTYLHGNALRWRVQRELCRIVRFILCLSQRLSLSYNTQRNICARTQIIHCYEAYTLHSTQLLLSEYSITPHNSLRGHRVCSNVHVLLQQHFKPKLLSNVVTIG